MKADLIDEQATQAGEEYRLLVRETTHDLRNHLGAILVYARTLELKNPGRPTGDIVADLVGQITLAGEKLDRLSEASE